MRMFRYEDYSKANRAKTKREPLYTLPEIADRLGVDYDNLKICMHTSKAEGYPSSPKPAMRVGTRSNARMSANMYRLSEFKLWLRELQEFNAKRQGDTT
jgi:hypothetical protein